MADDLSNALAAWSQQDEFDGILLPAPGTPETRPVMSPPPRYVAARSFVSEVAALLDSTDDVQEIADWIIGKMERYGSASALPMFTTEGEGPCCSWCGVVWPLCGHHLNSVRLRDYEAGAAGVSTKGDEL